jgi:hypothetical protein
MTLQRSTAEELPLESETRPSLFSPEWRKLLRVSERQETDALLESIRQQSRPLDKLLEATQHLPEESRAWEEAEHLLSEDPLFKEVPEQEQLLLKRTFVQALKSQDTAISEDILESLDLDLPIPPETDDYLVKTSHLIASKLATLLNRERFLHDVFQVGDIQLEKQVIAKHLLLVLEENKKLRQALAESQAELARFQPAGLGLFKKK